MAQTEVHNHLLLPIMNELISQGFKVEIIYTGNMSKKFKRANKINASFAVLLGEEEVAAPGKSISGTVAAPSKSSSSSAVEVGFEIIVQEKEGNAETILKSLMSTGPERMLKVLNNRRGINMLKQVTYLSAPKIREVLATESTISLEAIQRVPKTEEQLVKEKRQIENANDAVKAATSASRVAEIEAERKVSEEVETARELVAQEKIGASNAFREAFRAKESALAEKDEDKKNSLERSLNYMGLKPNMSAKDIKIDKVFIGSCTNGRIEDLREAAKILKDKKIASHVHAMVVPGSGLVKEQAEQEGLDKIFVNSGFEWREPGCSMCLAMNADKLKPEERCASTSNRNFEGRQGRGGRTHLVSPGMAAAAAISGNLDDVRNCLLYTSPSPRDRG